MWLFTIDLRYLEGVVSLFPVISSISAGLVLSFISDWIWALPFLRVLIGFTPLILFRIWLRLIHQIRISYIALRIGTGLRRPFPSLLVGTSWIFILLIDSNHPVVLSLSVGISWISLIFISLFPCGCRSSRLILNLYHLPGHIGRMIGDRMSCCHLLRRDI